MFVIHLATYISKRTEFVLQITTCISRHILIWRTIFGIYVKNEIYIFHGVHFTAYIYSVHFTAYIPRRTFHDVHFTMYISCNKSHGVHFTMYISRGTFHSIHYTRYIVCCTFTVYLLMRTFYGVPLM